MGISKTLKGTGFPINSMGYFISTILQNGSAQKWLSLHQLWSTGQEKEKKETARWIHQERNDVNYYFESIKKPIFCNKEGRKYFI